MSTPMETVNINREAPFLEDYRRRLMDSVFAAAGKPIKPWQRGMAPLSGMQTGAFDLASQFMGIDPTTGAQTGVAAFQPYMDLAKSTAELGIPALASAQGQYDPTGNQYKDFFNKYQADVTSDALKQMDEQGQMAQNKLAGQATRGGTFGGSRYGVESAGLSGNLQDIKSRRIFEDLSRNYLTAQGQAQSTFENARARDLATGQAYGQAGQGFANLGGQLASMTGQGLGQLFGAGQMQQTYDQSLLDEDFRYKTAQQQEPMTRLSWIQDMLSGVPSSGQKITQQPIPYTNPIVGAVGAGIAGLGAYKGLS
jgi:hypothetical protein